MSLTVPPRFRCFRLHLTHLYLIKALLPFCALLLLCLPLPSFAGQWQITLSGSTSTPNGGTGTYTFVNGQVTGPPPFPIAAYGPDYHPQLNLGGGQCGLTWLSNGSISMSVTAKLTWTPNYPGDTSQPPSTVYVLETGNAGSSVGLQNQTSVSTTADDGLGDAPTYPAAGYGYGAQSSGSHLIQLTVPAGQTSVTLPLRSLSATLSWQPASANVGAPGMSMSYSVQLFSTSLQAHSTVDTSAPGNPWDPTHPRFFSGTNCSASGTAPAISGYVSHAELLVGGTDVKDYYDTGFVGPLPPGAATGTNQSSASLTVHFDSTHFADGGSVPIQMTVTDTAGNTYDANVSANAYNKATIYGRNQWETGSGAGSAGTFAADSVLAGMNHTDTVNRTLGWSAANILADIGTCTVFYVNTHGETARTWLLSDLSELTGQVEFIFPSAASQPGTIQVLETRQNTSVNIPPINLAFVDSCLTGTTNEFANALLWPGASGSGQATDQAEVGWTISTATNSTNADGQAFWGSLASGDTVHVARDKMISAYFNPTAPPNPANTYATVWGDNYARLHSNAYTADDTQPANHWFR